MINNMLLFFFCGHRLLNVEPHCLYPLVLSSLLSFFFVSERIVTTLGSSLVSTKPLCPYPYTINTSNFISFRLTEENFLLWKTHVLVRLESQDLHDFVIGETFAPELYAVDESMQKQSPNPLYATWKKMDKLIKGWISSSLFESAIGLIVGHDTSN